MPLFALKESSPGEATFARVAYFDGGPNATSLVPPAPLMPRSE
jgi:hypothetical protein